MGRRQVPAKVDLVKLHPYWFAIGKYASENSVKEAIFKFAENLSIGDGEEERTFEAAKRLVQKYRLHYRANFRSYNPDGRRRNKIATPPSTVVLDFMDDDDGVDDVSVAVDVEGDKKLMHAAYKLINLFYIQEKTTMIKVMMMMMPYPNNPFVLWRQTITNRQRLVSQELLLSTLTTQIPFTLSWFMLVMLLLLKVRINLCILLVNKFRFFTFRRRRR
jgi:hypothetical protein